MSNHHLYLSSAWEPAAWNTNAIRSWESFFKHTHTHLAKPYLTDWRLCDSWDSLAINTWLIMKVSMSLYAIPPFLSIWVSVWVRIRGQMTRVALDLPFPLTQCAWLDKSRGLCFLIQFLNHVTNTRIIIKIRPLQKEVTWSQSPAPSLKGTSPTSLVQNFSLQTGICIFQSYIVLLSHINGGRLKRCFATCFFHSTVSLASPFIWGT